MKASTELSSPWVTLSRYLSLPSLIQPDMVRNASPASGCRAASSKKWKKRNPSVEPSSPRSFNPASRSRFSGVACCCSQGALFLGMLYWLTHPDADEGVH